MVRGRTAFRFKIRGVKLMHQIVVAVLCQGSRVGRWSTKFSRSQAQQLSPFFFSYRNTPIDPLDMVTVVLDNGASTIKVGIVGKDEKPRSEPDLNSFGLLNSQLGVNRIIPNAVIRSKGDKSTYFGHEMARCKDYSSLHYRLPFEKVWNLTCYFHANPLYSSSIVRATSWTGMPKRQFGTVSSQTKFLGWDFFHLSLPYSPHPPSRYISHIFFVTFLGGHNPGLSTDHRTLLQPSEFTRSLWSAGLRRVRI